MAPRIVVTIDRQGRVEADFVAFPGRSCEDAERQLRDELARWGVLVKGKAVKKAESQILQEQAEEKTCRPKTSPKISI